MSNYYATTAYNSNQPRHQPAQRVAPGIVGYQRLPWGSTQELMAIGLIDDSRDATLKEAQRLAPYQPNIPKEQWLYCNHEYLQPADISIFSFILEILCAGGKMLAFPALLLTVGVFILVYFIDNNPMPIKEQLKFYFFYFICFPGVLFYLWGIGAFLVKYFPQVFSIKGNGQTPWRLNRRTGMVSKFTYKDGKITEQTAPFDEFDGYIYTSMSRHGYLYEFELFHRYQGWGLNLAHIGGSKVDKCTVKNAWNFLQNYMDTGHALPEYPAFEMYRHLDSTTAQQDKQTGRSPRYWQDMSAEQWKEQEQLLGNPLRSNMDTRHCLFEEEGYVEYLSYCHWTPDPDYQYVK